MSGIKKPTYYWDSCIYCAWLHEEEAYKEWLPAIKAIVQENKELKNIIVTSAITLLEVLNLSEQQKKRFHDSFYYGVNVLAEVERPIVDRAKLYREWQLNTRTNSKVLQTPDAIHLATATVYDVDEFHTFDDGGKGNGCSLLKLNGSIMGDKLKICRPYIMQGLMLFNSDNPSYSEEPKNE